MSDVRDRTSVNPGGYDVFGADPTVCRTSPMSAAISADKAVERRISAKIMSTLTDGHKDAAPANAAGLPIIIAACWRMALHVALPIAACFTITSCVSSTSALDSQDDALRSGLIIDKQPLPELAYPATQVCQYTLDNVSMAGGPHTHDSLRVTFSPVKNNLHVVLDLGGGKASGYLISRSGKLYSYNAQSRYSPDIYNPETQQTVGNEAVSKATRSSPQSTNFHAFNPFVMEFPEYAGGPWAPGNVVATVRSDDGSISAVYQYAGVSYYRGKRVAVLDLLHTRPSGNTVVVGFSLVDVQTALPIDLVFNSGSSIHLEQVSCS